MQTFNKNLLGQNDQDSQIAYKIKHNYVNINDEASHRNLHRR